MSERSKGWALVAPAKKHHYYRDGMSLCGRWGLFAGTFDADDPAKDNPKRDCADCLRRVKKTVRKERTA